MIINYFNKYNIDTVNLKEKLNIIENSKTENAGYITHVFLAVIEYLFLPIKLNINNINKFENKKADCLILFDTIFENEVSFNISTYSKVFVIGNHPTRTVNDKLCFCNIKEFLKLKEFNFKDVQITFNIESINFTKYYYNRMRCYFLNFINSLDKCDIDNLKNNTERVCKELLINEKNFNCLYTSKDNSILFKDMAIIISKLFKLTNIKTIYYLSNSDSLDEMKINMLNEMSNLIDVYNIQDNEEKLSFIYNKITDNLLKEALAIDYCNFINNKCITSRYTKGFPNSKENGCCSNTYKDKRKNCRYLKEDHSCSINSISCRAFTCVYLQQRGIDHSLWQYPLIDCLFKKFGKIKIVSSFFTPKEVMLKKLKTSLKY